MKKLLLVLTAICCSILYTYAQQFELAKHIGGYDDDRVSGVGFDAFGNMYVSGSFAGQIDFHTDTHMSQGEKDFFVVKYDASGQFLWSLADGNIFDDYIIDMEVDDSGRVYVTGYGELRSDGSERSMFIAKVDENGTVEWSKTIASTMDKVAGDGIAVDSSGNIIVGGNFNGKIYLGGELTTTGTVSSSDPFVFKMDQSGNVLWARQFATNNNNAGVADVCVDKEGNVYTTGNYWNNAFNGNPGTGTSSISNKGLGDIFITKLDKNGNYVWSKGMGGSKSDYGLSIAADDSGNVYTTGYFEQTVDFDPNAGTYNMTSNGNRDCFVSKLDSTGNLVWAQHFGGSDMDYGTGLQLDAQGNVYIVGAFKDTVDFDLGASIHNLASNGERDIFVHKLNANGSFGWAQSIGSLADEIPGPIALNNNQLLIAGTFKDTIDVEPNTGTTALVSKGSNDIFLTRWNLCTVDATVAVNGNIITANSTGLSYQWVDCDNGNAPISGETSATFQAEANGNYAVIVSEGGCSVTSNCTAITNVNVEQLGATHGARVFPNPTKGSFQVVNPNSQMARIMVYNSSGQFIELHTMSAVQETFELPASGGIYLIQVQTDTSVETFRLIKQ